MRNRSTYEKGKHAEDLAVMFLEGKGLRILARNYRYARGEIDVVAEENGEIVFVEVKARHSSEFGAPEEAISDEKKEQIYSVAEYYLSEYNIENRPCRFDLVAIQFHKNSEEISHIKNAF